MTKTRRMRGGMRLFKKANAPAAAPAAAPAGGGGDVLMDDSQTLAQAGMTEPDGDDTPHKWWWYRCPRKKLQHGPYGQGGDLTWNPARLKELDTRAYDPAPAGKVDSSTRKTSNRLLLDANAAPPKGGTESELALDPAL